MALPSRTSAAARPRGGAERKSHNQSSRGQIPTKERGESCRNLCSSADSKAWSGTAGHSLQGGEKEDRPRQSKMAIESGLVLMPMYALASWIAMLKLQPGSYEVYIAAIGWAWALLNIVLKGTFDLGSVTFALAIAAFGLERRTGLTGGIKLFECIASVAVALNFSLVIVLWQDIKSRLSKSKSQAWLTVFLVYCITFAIYWALIAVRTYKRGESGYATVS